jgi:hypothetical protein
MNHRIRSCTFWHSLATMMIAVDPAWAGQALLRDIDVILGFSTGTVQAMASFVAKRHLSLANYIPPSALDGILCWSPKKTGTLI